MQPQASSKQEQAYPYILYLSAKTHVNEYKLVKNAQLEHFILLQDVANGPAQLPPWLDVLPTLVDTKTMMAYRGHSCFEKMMQIDLPPEHLKRLSRKKNDVKKFE